MSERAIRARSAARDVLAEAGVAARIGAGLGALPTARKEKLSVCVVPRSRVGAYVNRQENMSVASRALRQIRGRRHGDSGDRASAGT